MRQNSMMRKFGTHTEASNDRDHFHSFRHAHNMSRSSFCLRWLKTCCRAYPNPWTHRTLLIMGCGAADCLKKIPKDQHVSHFSFGLYGSSRRHRSAPGSVLVFSPNALMPSSRSLMMVILSMKDYTFHILFVFVSRAVT